MWVRKRFEIGWADLAYGIGQASLPRGRSQLARRLELCWSSEGDAVACLSVRSGFDLWVQAAAFPRGSEVLISAVTIPDMPRIVAAHGLVPVPIDVNPDDLSVDLDSLRRSITPATRAVLVAHLFGTRQCLDELIEIARAHRLAVVEDCAQAFAGRTFTGHSEADISMFSFGPIKTTTALGGALLRVRNNRLLRRMRQQQAGWPVQTRRAYANRVLKYAGMKTLSNRWTFAAAWRAIQACGGDPDRTIGQAVRGFPGPQFFDRIRQQPSPALLAMMQRRLNRDHQSALQQRTAAGCRLAQLLGRRVPRPGADAEMNSYWVFPVLSQRRELMISELQRCGFDASAAHSLHVVPAPAGRPECATPMAAGFLPQIVHLPCYAAMPDQELARLAAIVREIWEREEALARHAAEHADRTAAVTRGFVGSHA